MPESSNSGSRRSSAAAGTASRKTPKTTPNDERDWISRGGAGRARSYLSYSFVRYRIIKGARASAVLACCRTSRSRSGRRTCANGAACSLSTCGQKVRSAGCWYIACTAMAGGRALVRCQLRRDARHRSVTLWGLAARQSRSGPILHQGPVSVPVGGMAAASSHACSQRVGSRFVLLRSGRVLVQDELEGADPSNERLAARLYRACGPDTAEKSVTRKACHTIILLSCP